MRFLAAPALLAATLAAEGRPAGAQVSGVSAEPPAAAGGGAAPSPGARAYDSDGRRDPFVNPFRRRAPRPEAARPPGLAGIAVDDLTLRGLVRIDGAYVAVLEYGNGRSHLFRGGERLFDGSVRAVSAGGVIVHRDRGGASGSTVHLKLSTANDEER